MADTRRDAWGIECTCEAASRFATWHSSTCDLFQKFSADDHTPPPAPTSSEGATMGDGVTGDWPNRITVGRGKAVHGATADAGPYTIVWTACGRSQTVAPDDPRLLAQTSTITCATCNATITAADRTTEK
ncbi:hypothetical protein [Streptomyces sp. NPDC059631]|uniref:hypothetical protein n=1 Tax=unclassified Streptomyces TaxID=2593676 RepID=UPI00368546AE